jgi:hypothetical protein
MSEQAMWTLLAEKLKAAGVGAERITEKLNAGVPDVVYQFPREYDGMPYRESDGGLSIGSGPGPTGWVELKFLSAEKVRDGLVRIPWKNADQPFWLQRWVRWGGRAGVLLYVKDTGWYYWRPWVTIDWLDWIKGSVGLAHPIHPDKYFPTWQCGPRLSLQGLLDALRA